MAGRPKDVTDAEILKTVKMVFGPATAGEISDEVGLNNSGTNKRLTDLTERGLVHKKKVGANAAVYWLTDEGKDFIQSEA